MPKTTKIGPKGGNKCCKCCGKCTPPVAGNDIGGCPAHCCPCPPTGNICVQFADPAGHGACPNLMASCFTMEPAVVTGGSSPPYTHISTYNDYGCGVNPQKDVGGESCYNPEYTGCEPCGPGGDPNKDFMKSIGDWEFEKWSYSGVVCQTGSCDGEKVVISLCCCDTPSAANQSASFSDDCHACRYQFTWEWQHQDGTYEYCTCPPLGMFDYHLIPPEDGAPGGANIATWNMQEGKCGSGVPEVLGGNEGWAITFNLTDVLWNCDCCAGGTILPLSVLAIVTPEPPEGCC